MLVTSLSCCAVVVFAPGRSMRFASYCLSGAVLELTYSPDDTLMGVQTPGGMCFGPDQVWS